MQEMIKVVALGGSLAEESTSLAALRVALEGAQSAGAMVELFNIRELDLPFYSPAAALLPPPDAVRLAEAVYEAQGLLWSSPLYHGSISGSFKNAIDWLDLLRGRQPAFLTDKVVGLISTSGGVQGLQAVNTMEFCVRALRAWAVPLVLTIGQSGQRFRDGELIEPGVDSQLRLLGSEVVRAARQFAVEGTCDYVPR